MARVVWTNAEKATVEFGLAEIFAQNPEKRSETAMREAQELLPMERRLVITAQRVHSHKAMIQRARAQGEAIQERSSAQRVEAKPEQPAIREIDPSSIGTLFELLIDRLVDVAYEMVSKRLKADYGQEVERQFDKEYAKQNAADRRAMVDSAVVAPKKPSILVVGLLANQANTIRAQFGKAVDLHFLGSDEAKHKSWPAVNHIYLMTKFISHSVQSKSKTMGATTGLVDGGTSELTRRINIFLNAKVGHPC